MLLSSLITEKVKKGEVKTAKVQRERERERERGRETIAGKLEDVVVRLCQTVKTEKTSIEYSSCKEAGNVHSRWHAICVDTSYLQVIL